jgi:hypothetical protein
VYDSALGGVLAKAVESSKGITHVVEIGGKQQGAFAGEVSHMLHPSGDKLGQEGRVEGGGGRGGGATSRPPTSEECSILYTSGSSGKAKGVLLSHVGHMIQALEKVAQVPILGLLGVLRLRVCAT